MTVNLVTRASVQNEYTSKKYYLTVLSFMTVI